MDAANPSLVETAAVSTATEGHDAAAGPIVRQFRQILIWPLQVMPLRPGAQVQRHCEFLERANAGNPWREVEDEFTGDPTQFQERHYREFVTFLPYVQRFLYGQGRSTESRRGYGESPISVFRRRDVAAARVSLDDGAALDFHIAHVDLYFFYDIDVVILVVEVYANDLPLARAQDTLFRLGRAFPARWDEQGHAVECARSVQWIGHAGEVLAASDYDDRANYLAFVCEHRAPRIASHWQWLLQPMVQHHSDQPGTLRYRQIEYHRMPQMNYLAFDDPFALGREDFVRLGLASQPDPGRGESLSYSQQTLAEFETIYCYDRFWAPERHHLTSSTRIVCTGHGFSMIGKSGTGFFSDAERGMLGEFRHQYFLIGLIAHFHKAALLMLSDRLVVAVSTLDLEDADSIKRFKRAIRQATEIFLRFNHRYWFHEISNQAMARDLFHMWRHHLGNDALFEEVRAEIEAMIHYLDSDDVRRQADTVLRLTVVTIFGLIAGIVTGFLGMNLFVLAEESPLVKLAYFLLVFLPTVFLTVITVVKSKGLSEFFDALSDERLSWRARLAVLRKVWRRRPRRT